MSDGSENLKARGDEQSVRAALADIKLKITGVMLLFGDRHIDRTRGIALCNEALDLVRDLQK